jgi:hypothetical protein
MFINGDFIVIAQIDRSIRRTCRHLLKRTQPNSNRIFQGRMTRPFVPDDAFEQRGDRSFCRACNQSVHASGKARHWRSTTNRQHIEFLENLAKFGSPHGPVQDSSTTQVVADAEVQLSAEIGSYARFPSCDECSPCPSEPLVQDASFSNYDITEERFQEPDSGCDLHTSSELSDSEFEDKASNGGEERELHEYLDSLENDEFPIDNSMSDFIPTNLGPDQFGLTRNWTCNALIGLFLHLTLSENDTQAVLGILKDPQFKPSDVPSFKQIQRIKQCLPATPVKTISVEQYVKSSDGSAKTSSDRVLEKKVVELDIILPSAHLARELASPAVSSVLDLASVDNPPDKIRDFRSSPFYAKPQETFAPQLQILNRQGDLQTIHIGDFFETVSGCFGLVLKMGCECADDPMQYTCRYLKAVKYRSLSDRQKAQCSVFLKSHAITLAPARLIFLQPTTLSEDWNPEQYSLLNTTEIKNVLEVTLRPKPTQRSSKLACLMQIRSDTGDVIRLNKSFFRNNLKNLYSKHVFMKTGQWIWVTLYADGFRTWVSRSGSTVGLYMSIAQHSLESSRMTENILVIGLIPKGVPVLEVLRHVVSDLQILGTSGIRLWRSRAFGSPTDSDPVGWSDFRCGVAALKGDTPQRTEFTNTVGHAGSCICQICSTNNCSITDLLNPTLSMIRRRNVAQYRRVQQEFERCASKSESSNLRKLTGYTHYPKGVSD